MTSTRAGCCASPEIADLQLVSPKIVYVFGKTPGETNLFAVGEDDRVLVNAVVRVNQNLGGLNDALASLLPGQAISVQPVQGGLVLSGTVSDAISAADAERVAQRYAVTTSSSASTVSVQPAMDTGTTAEWRRAVSWRRVGRSL